MQPFSLAGRTLTQSLSPSEAIAAQCVTRLAAMHLRHLPPRVLAATPIGAWAAHRRFFLVCFGGVPISSLSRHESSTAHRSDSRNLY